MVVDEVLKTLSRERRIELDWLRVLVFGLLILYHTGMLYVQNWGYHYKSSYLSQSLEHIMLLVNPWRMPLLWFISGVAIRYVLEKISWYRFIWLRSVRLLVPLLFGVLVIVPPQLYVEMTAKGDLALSYWQFYQIFFDVRHPAFDHYQPGIWPHIDVNHLWYLRELWTWSLLLLCLTPLLAAGWLQRGINHLLAVTPAGLLWLLPMVPLLVLRLNGIEHRKIEGLIFLLYGYLLAFQPLFWHKIVRYRRVLLCLSVSSYLLVMLIYQFIWLDSGRQLSAVAETGLLALYLLDKCSWLLLLLAYSCVYLTRPHRWLAYLSDAVLPYYALHQSLIIVAAFCLTPYQLGPVLEPLLVLSITVSGCVLGYELFRRIPFAAALLGGNINNAAPADNHYMQYSVRVGKILLGAILLLFGLEILL